MENAVKCSSMCEESTDIKSMLQKKQNYFAVVTWVQVVCLDTQIKPNRHESAVDFEPVPSWTYAATSILRNTHLW